MAQGRLAARFGHVNGRTRLIEHHQCAPLKIARTFEAAAGGLEVCVMDASPGLLSGDQYQFDWHLEAGTRVRITTQGATRVHPARGAGSQQTTRVHVAVGAHLELWPETVIPFAGAQFTSRLEAFVAEGAGLILFESLSAGRVGHGEKFAFESVDTRLLVRDASGPLLCSQNRFTPAEFPLEHPFRWGQATQWSCLYAWGDFGAPQLEIARRTLEEGPISGSASLLARRGIGVCMLGQRAYDLRCAAHEIAQQMNDAMA